MPAEPDIKRAVSFIDGQNLYRHAKDAFGYHHPNYDPRKLADAVCAERGWVNHGVAGIVVTTRYLRYRVERVRLPDGSVHEIPVEREKGIDLRLGLDVVACVRLA